MRQLQIAHLRARHGLSESQAVLIASLSFGEVDK